MTFREEREEREERICQLVAQGKTNAEIAALVKLSESSVQTAITKLFDQTGCDSRLQLALYYVDKLTRNGANPSTRNPQKP